MERLDALMQADVLELCGNAREAARLREQSIVGASENDVICYAYTLLWRNVTEGAIELLEENVALHPDSWNAHDTLAEAHAQNGDGAPFSGSRSVRLHHGEDRRAAGGDHV